MTTQNNDLKTKDDILDRVLTAHADLAMIISNNAIYRKGKRIGVKPEILSQLDEHLDAYVNPIGDAIVQLHRKKGRKKNGK